MMNRNSVPQIIYDESLFAAVALAAARHVARQPAHIRAPIARYGEHLHKGLPVDSGVLYEFYRALCQARVAAWTDQIADYPDPHARLEETIAINVYLAQSALSLNAIDESQ